MAAPDYVYGDGHITEFNIVCAAVILVIGIPGIFVNVITLIMLRTLPSFKNSFGSLCTSRCVSNFIFLVIMVTMTAVPGLYQPVHLSYFLSARTGQIMMLTNHSTMISHVIIAINRFMALFWTSMVAKVFNSGWLFVIIFIQWLISVLYVVPLSFDWLQCNFIFETNAVSFMFQDNYCTRIMSTIDFYIQVFDCAMLVILNCTAFLNLMFRHKELNKVTDRFQKQRIRTRNLRFFAQEIIHAALFVFDFMNYAFIFPHVAQYPFLKFFLAMDFGCLCLLLIVPSLLRSTPKCESGSVVTYSDLRTLA